MLGVLLLAWWYFDSTSFPYQLLWRFSLSIFFESVVVPHSAAEKKKDQEPPVIE
jgi:hypothetical protein